MLERRTNQAVSRTSRCRHAIIHFRSSRRADTHSTSEADISGAMRSALPLIFLTPQALTTGPETGWGWCRPSVRPHRRRRPWRWVIPTGRGVVRRVRWLRRPRRWWRIPGGGCAHRRLSRERAGRCQRSPRAGPAGVSQLGLVRQPGDNLQRPGVRPGPHGRSFTTQTTFFSRDVRDARND
jgi:hypothetical protein